MHYCGKSIVGGGRHVDVVVRVNRLFGTLLTAEDLDCAVGDDFVGVHI